MKFLPPEIGPRNPLIKRLITEAIQLTEYDKICGICNTIGNPKREMDERTYWVIECKTCDHCWLPHSQEMAAGYYGNRNAAHNFFSYGFDKGFAEAIEFVQAEVDRLVSISEAEEHQTTYEMAYECGLQQIKDWLTDLARESDGTSELQSADAAGSQTTVGEPNNQTSKPEGEEG